MADRLLKVATIYQPQQEVKGHDKSVLHRALVVSDVDLPQDGRIGLGLVCPSEPLLARQHQPCVDGLIVDLGRRNRVRQVQRVIEGLLAAGLVRLVWVVKQVSDSLAVNKCRILCKWVLVRKLRLGSDDSTVHVDVRDGRSPDGKRSDAHQ